MASQLPWEGEIRLKFFGWTLSRKLFAAHRQPYLFHNRTKINDPNNFANAKVRKPLVASAEQTVMMNSSIE
jgi:hypothetical protein